MPYRRGKRKYRKSRKSKISSVSKAKLMDSKINTIFERRALAITKKEIAKNHPTLVFRKYVWGEYSQALNFFNPGQRLDWDGLSHHPCQIPLTDNASLVQSGVIVDPDFVVAQENQATQFGRGAGVNFVASQYQLSGTRIGYKIKIKSIEMSLRARMDLCTDAQPVLDKVFIKYSLVSYYDAATPLQATQLDAEKGLSMRRWGYSSKIDGIEKNKTANTCHLRHHGSGGFYMDVSTTDVKLKQINKRWNLKNMTYEYTSNDPKMGNLVQSQYGQRVVGPKLFILFRSDVRALEANLYKPLVQVCYKVNYTNVI